MVIGSGPLVVRVVQWCQIRRCGYQNSERPDLAEGYCVLFLELCRYRLRAPTKQPETYPASALCCSYHDHRGRCLLAGIFSPLVGEDVGLVD